MVVATMVMYDYIYIYNMSTPPKLKLWEDKIIKCINICVNTNHMYLIL